MRIHQKATHRILGGAIVALCALGIFATAAPAQDPAEALYERATQELDKSRFETAAELYAQLYAQNQAHVLAKDALYWEAFARYRLGKDKELLRAGELLEKLQADFPTAAILTDAGQLAIRIQGLLAKRGNAEAAERVYALAQRLAERYSVSAQGSPQEASGTPEAESEADQVQIAALNALLHMDADRARPILRKVLQRKDEGSNELRAQALFILSQSDSEENQDLLIQVLREDPNPELRQQAMFWLGQMPNEKSLAVIEDVLRRDENPEMREQALFALSQSEEPRANELLRATALDTSAPAELRVQAIQWLGQRGTLQDLDFMQQLYGDLDDPEAKEQLLFAVSNIPGDASRRWLMDVALNPKEPMELRARAVFCAGQSGAISPAELHQLYQQIDAREMREQLIFVLSQQDSPEAVETMMRIAREEQDVELKTQAIFWLGQSDDPRVPDFIAEIIER